MPTPSPTTPADLPDAPDVRLIAVDMDGTLLDPDHEVPPTLWPLLDELEARGIAFCPASGRQLATLARQLGAHAPRLCFIAENGGLVVREGEVLSTDVVDPAVVVQVVEAVRALAASGADVGAVVCGTRSAYVERHDAAFVDECDRYYALLARVDDLTAVGDDVLKVAVFDFGDAAATTEPALARFRDTQQVVVSGAHWVDLMNPTTHKGAALKTVQRALGVTREQTMAFGDYLNDRELLDAAAWSYAMANAHPEVRARARFAAPGNDENGVVRTIAAVLGIAVEGVAPLDAGTAVAAP
ncbi:Cof-type HAD-IIB family hydrolase [Cellulomonas cellasea]|uniref:HAD family hydrolase n=2 Tax=Cellulomonas cellasea TaxID=43670 RepID=A0A0A0BAT9_9CELL|nr:Cof-type HAD-IIB family hydrolase [Cellulomonas cellasea]KGM03298.1 HAD family hydrolase [Cellulomonas cellasea DSM 20118]GEA86548.1 hydrolase [Cellulomonas cellasea]